jgi:hypothetical protein
LLGQLVEVVAVDELEALRALMRAMLEHEANECLPSIFASQEWRNGEAVLRAAEPNVEEAEVGEAGA